MNVGFSGLVRVPLSRSNVILNLEEPGCYRSIKGVRPASPYSPASAAGCRADGCDSCASYRVKTHRICEEFIGYTSRDIEIFITAYEIAASIAKQSREYRAHTSERPKNRLLTEETGINGSERKAGSHRAWWTEPPPMGEERVPKGINK